MQAHDAKHGTTRRTIMTSTLAESPAYFREVYTLGKFFDGRLSISVYIDALTVCMFVHGDVDCHLHSFLCHRLHA